MDWRVSFLKARVIYETMIGLDYCPIFIDLQPVTKRVKTDFKFEASWLSNSECKDFVSNAWRRQFRRSWLFRVARKLKICRSFLSNWKRHSTFNNLKVISKLNEKLIDLQNASPTAENLIEQSSLINEMDEVRKKDEEYWWQRSRIN